MRETTDLKEAAGCLRWVAKNRLLKARLLAGEPASESGANALTRLADRLEKASHANLSEEERSLLTSAVKNLKALDDDASELAQRELCLDSIRSLMGEQPRA